VSAARADTHAKPDKTIAMNLFRLRTGPIAHMAFFQMAMACMAVFGAHVPCAWASEAPAANPARPNIILIVVDALRADRLTADRNGVPVMPKLRQYAAGSLWFQHAYSQESWTLPSVSTMFTSLYPETHGVRYQPLECPGKAADPALRGLPADFKTLAMYLKELGYHTVGIQTNPHLQDVSGFARGFDTYTFAYGAFADRITRETLAAASRAPQPLFLYVHYFDPHDPYFVHPPFDTIFGPLPAVEPWEKALIEDYIPYHREARQWMAGTLKERLRQPLKAAGRAYLAHAYDVECAYTDAHLDRLLMTLRAMGKLNRDSVVIVTADHGEEIWEHGFVGHGRTVYQESIHVPLLMRLPGRAPERIEWPVESIDLLPTIMAILGVPADPAWQGRNLLPVLNSGGYAEDRVIHATARGDMPRFASHCDAVLQGKWKLVVDDSVNKTELFDLSDDPGEQRNLAGDNPAILERLGALLDAHRKTCGQHPAYAPNRGAKPLSQEAVDQLKALGYLQ